jgi:hypothetical protein
LRCFCPSSATEHFLLIISLDLARRWWCASAHTSWQYSSLCSYWCHQYQQSMALNRNWNALLSNRSMIGTCQHLLCCVPWYSDSCL